MTVSSVEHVIWPAFRNVCTELSLNPDLQHALFQLDVVSKQRGKAFRDWCLDKFPRLHLVFISGITINSSVICPWILNNPRVFCRFHRWLHW